MTIRTSVPLGSEVSVFADRKGEAFKGAPGALPPAPLADEVFSAVPAEFR